MKILELTNFSEGICGVWSRVREESLRLANKGHEVVVFSSDFIKGQSGRAKKEDRIGKVKIKRFKGFRLGGESYMIWGGKKLENEIIKHKPEVIIAHSYRHTHTVIASRAGKKIGAKKFLVTHAPFVEEGTRSFLAKLYIKYFHDPFVGKSTLKRFDKILHITKWEIPYLLNLGVDEGKLIYSPNGIPEEFFDTKKGKEENKIVFLGRISPIKNLEVLINSIKLIKDKKIKLEIIGPGEKDYVSELKLLIDKLDLKNRIEFSGPVYELKDKIEKIDSCSLFVLPSKRESMPQSLIEGMAREKIIISSDNKGSSELIKDGVNGYLFRVGDEKDLARKINLALDNKEENKKMKKEARKSVERFSWDKVIEGIDKVIQKRDSS
jgi:glycosyltransferase involved in cell wall biosynthesis